MKRFLAVFLCCLLLFRVATPALAAGVDSEPMDELIEFVDAEGNVVFTVDPEGFNYNDYVIPYEHYFGAPATYNAAVGVLGFEGGLAWSEAFASAGLVCSSGGLYMLGVLACAGVLGWGIYNICEILMTDGVEVFYDFISLVYMNSSAETKAWLEEAFDLYVAEQAITVTPAISEDIVNAIKGNLYEDSAGNTIDTSIILSTDYIGGVREDSYTAKVSYNADYTFMTLADVPNGSTTFEMINDVLTWTKESADSGLTTILNNKTGAQITFNAAMTGLSSTDAKQVCIMTKWYNFVSTTTGEKFWYPYFGGYKYKTGWGYGRPAVPSNISEEYPVTFANTDTILDGKTVTGVTYNPGTGLWDYLFGDGETAAIPIDPFGMVISNTGALTTGTGVLDPTDVKPNEEDKTTTLPYAPPIAGTDNPAIGIPKADVLEDALTDAKEEAGTTTPDTTLDPTAPTWLTGFIDMLMDALGKLLSSLFVPADGFFENFISKITATFEGRMGILTYPLSVLFDFFNRLLTIGEEEPRLVWGSWKYQGVAVIPAGSFNFNDFLENEVIARIHSIYLVIVDAGIIFGLINLLRKKYDAIVGS